MARNLDTPKSVLTRRQVWIREKELQQNPIYGDKHDDDPSDHGLMDKETVFAEEDDTVRSLDQIFR